MEIKPKSSVKLEQKSREPYIRRPHSSIDFLTPEQAHGQEGIIKKRWKQYSKQEKSKEQIQL
jgi:hypothetical protein